jgi:hypothetical protein
MALMWASILLARPIRSTEMLRGHVSCDTAQEVFETEGLEQTERDTLHIELLRRLDIGGHHNQRDFRSHCAANIINQG